MKNHDLLFDKDNKRIGMVRANCSAVVDISTPTYSAEHPSAASTTSPSSTSEPESTPESGSKSEPETETQTTEPEKTQAPESTESTSGSQEPETKPADSDKAPIDQTMVEKDPNANVSDFTENQITQVSTNNNDTDYWSTYYYLTYV